MRTELGPSKLYRNGKWFPTFLQYNGTPGNEYLAGTISAPAWFETENEAYAAGQRAMAVLEQTDKFPNMCEPF
jgi:hypothetical protein